MFTIITMTTYQYQRRRKRYDWLECNTPYLAVAAVYRRQIRVAISNR